MIKQDIEEILNYLWESEETHFEETDEEERENHIFLTLKRVREWLDKPTQIQIEEIKNEN